MKIGYVEAAEVLGIHPLQVLLELAAMNQPWLECWPEMDDGFVQTLRERRRTRMGFSRTTQPFTTGPNAIDDDGLPVSALAAAILDKLQRKSYGLRSIRVSTLVQKWVHEATEEHVRELVQRGYLEWTDGSARSAVNLVASKLADMERVVEVYRRRADRGRRQATSLRAPAGSQRIRRS